MSMRLPARAVCVGLCVLAGSAVAGPMAPEFRVELSMNAQTSRPAPGSASSYSFFASAHVQGYTMDPHPDNRVRVRSNNGAFLSEITPSSGFSQSTAFPTFGGLYGAINDGAGWVMSIRDGATGLEYEYTFGVTAPTLTADHMRPITINGLTPGQQIPSEPTFEWSIEPSTDPLIQYEDTFALLFGASPVFHPTVAPNATSWTPAGPLTPGVYDLTVQYQGYTPVDLAFPTTPAATGGAPDLAEFSFWSTFSSYSAVVGLQVIPAPGSAAALLLGSGLLLRRRR